jgi:arylsulfatase A-like enzyme
VRACAALGAAAAAVLAPVAAAPAGRAAERRTRPNIVVIMTDDQTVENLRVMKNVEGLLAANGTTFDDFVTSFPLCCPSRATFLRAGTATTTTSWATTSSTGSPTSTTGTRCRSGCSGPAT